MGRSWKNDSISTLKTTSKMATRKKAASTEEASVDLQAVAAVAFAEHAHATKVWVDESTGEWYLHEKKNTTLVERED